MLVALRLIFWMKDATNTHEVIDRPSSSPGAPGAPAFLSGAIGLIVIMSIIRFLQVGGVGTATTFFNVYLDDQLGFPPSGSAGFWRSQSYCAALAVPLVTRRLGNAGTTIVASAIVVAAIMPIAFVPVWWVAGIGYILCWSVTPMRYSAFLVLYHGTLPTAVARQHEWCRRNGSRAKLCHGLADRRLYDCFLRVSGALCNRCTAHVGGYALVLGLCNTLEKVKTGESRSSFIWTRGNA